MSASLVGSEMCIRDRRRAAAASGAPWPAAHCGLPVARADPAQNDAPPRACLLYTSDAADDM
eukprot:1379424-Alexandrium_andersonii.AAC.1